MNNHLLVAGIRPLVERLVPVRDGGKGNAAVADAHLLHEDDLFTRLPECAAERALRQTHDERLGQEGNTRTSGKGDCHLSLDITTDGQHEVQPTLRGVNAHGEIVVVRGHLQIQFAVKALQSMTVGDIAREGSPLAL